MEISDIFLLVLLIFSGFYLILMLLMTLQTAWIKAPESGSPPLSPVSVVIPARDEEENIVACLESLKRQDYAEGLFEVIVVNDFSDDHTRDRVNQFRENNPGFPLVLMNTNDPGGSGSKKKALETGIVAANNDLILTTDADTRHSPSWISAMAGEYERSHAKMLLGPVFFHHSRGPAGWFQELEFLGIMGITAGAAMSGNPVMGNGANLGFTKTAFQEAGRYEGNEHFLSGDDQFLLMKFRKRYGKQAIQFVFDRKAIITAKAETSLTGFMNQRLRWVSKSRGYTDPGVWIAAFLTFFLNSLLLAGVLAGIFYTPLLMPVLVLFGIKCLGDIVLMFRMASFFGKYRVLWFFPAGEVLNLVYVPLTGLLGNIIPSVWKGRVIRPLRQ